MRLGVLLLLLATTLTGCSFDEVLRLGFPEPATEQGESVMNLWQGSWIASLVVGLLVWGLIFYAAIRYRKKGDELPRQVRYNLPIEVLYTLVPFVIVAVLFYYTVVVQNDLNDVSEEPDVRVGVVGFQWSWQFNYIDEDVQVTGSRGVTPELVVPVGEQIRFVLTSPDVIHSFWVPHFLFKRDVIPGHPNKFQVIIEEPGEYVGRCAELCGVYHDRMNFTLVAVSPDEYQDFLDQERSRPSPLEQNPTAG